MTPVTVATVLLLALVAWGQGGYDPWATLALELGAAGLFLILSLAAMGRGESEERRRARLGAWKRLPFAIRHPEAADWIRVLSLGRVPLRRSSARIEILMPGSSGARGVELDPEREVFLLGQPVKRTGLLAPLALLSLWIVLSLLPLGRGTLEILSPVAHLARVEAEELLEIASPAAAAPWSLSPFLTFRSLWIWIAIVLLFAVSFRLARSPAGASRLALALLVLGALSGVAGVVEWLQALRGAYGQATQSLRASGTFGNPNHYASFQGMLLLVSLGWLGWFRSRSPGGEAPRDPWRDRALAFIAGIAILALCLGLTLSLSRSGIAFALAGAVSYVVLTSNRRSEGRGLRGSRGPILALAVGLLSLLVWMGIEPLVGRFANLQGEWDREGTRVQVWRDSLPAVSDFWLTGSGLSSYRYLGARYRTFGGRVFYSWAHNDYLQLGIELGVPGLLLLGWIGLAVWRAARRAREDLAASRPLLLLHAGYLSAIAVVALHSATDFSLHLPANFALLAILVGAVVGMESRGRAISDSEGLPPPRRRRW